MNIEQAIALAKGDTGIVADPDFDPDCFFEVASFWVGDGMKIPDKLVDAGKIGFYVVSFVLRDSISIKSVVNLDHLVAIVFRKYPTLRGFIEVSRHKVCKSLTGDGLLVLMKHGFASAIADPVKNEVYFFLNRQTLQYGNVMTLINPNNYQKWEG